MGGSKGFNDGNKQLFIVDNDVEVLHQGLVKKKKWLRGAVILDQKASKNKKIKK